MDKELIKKLVDIKLDALDTAIGIIPAKRAEKFVCFGKTVLEAVNKHVDAKKPEEAGKIKGVSIE